MFIIYRPQDLPPSLDYASLLPEHHKLLGKIKKSMKPTLEDLAVLDASTPIRIIAEVFLSLQLSEGNHIGDFTATLPRDFVHSDEYQRMLCQVLLARTLPSEVVRALQHNVLTHTSLLSLFEKWEQLACYVAQYTKTPVLQNLILDWALSTQNVQPSDAVETICGREETPPEILAKAYEKVYHKLSVESRYHVLNSLITNPNTPSSVVTQVFLDSIKEQGFTLVIAILVAKHPNLDAESIIRYVTSENVVITKNFVALLEMDNSTEIVERALTSWGFSVGDAPMPVDFLQYLYKKTVNQLAS